MNAITMKLESRQLPVPLTKEKSRVSLVGKKCKNNRKKSIPANTDKDAVFKSHGLGRKSGDTIDLTESKSNMPLEFNSTKRVRPKKVGSKVNDKMPPKSEKMQERLEQFLSPGVKEKISSILNDVKSLTDVEKLYLYLQLPTGASLEVDPLKPKGQNPLGKKADEEGMIAVTWIQSHFEEDPDVSLPKQEVYNEYQSYCHMTQTDSLCAADFGKVMKQIFPSVKPRRLGTRGNSRYCYSGLRKKVKLKPPRLPDMQAEVENSDLNEESIKDEATSAACHILFQWAEKLLGLKFTSLKNLASHLLENMYVDNRSVAAFTVLLESSPQVLEKGFSNCEGGIKKSDAQMHLQRKIQEKELIKEQKKKMQEQRSSVAVLNKGKTSASKKKGVKSKKSKLLLNSDFTDLSTLDKGTDNLLTKNNESSSEGTMMQENINFEIKEEDFDLDLITVTPSKSPATSDIVIEQPSPCKKISPHTSPGSISAELEDSIKKKNNFLLSPSSTPVCIAQTIPGIIIVPSIPQLADIGKQNTATPKYKRIQPKPLRGEGASAVMRSRAGSVGSTIVTKSKTRSSDGRRSSHAWLQSACSPDGCEDSISRSVSNPNGVKIVSVRSTSQKNSFKKNNFVFPKDMIVNKTLDSTNVLDATNPQLTTGAAAVEIIANLSPGQMSSKSISELMLKSCLAGHCVDSGLPSEENSAVKRHIDESDEQSASKRPHIDSGQNLDVLDSILTWPRDMYAANNLTGPSLQNTSLQPAGEEEVSVHDIEGDALVDYMRGANSNAALFTSLPTKEILETDQKQLSSSNKVKKLSQLRMLLEQNLPRKINYSSVICSKDETKSEVPIELMGDTISFSKPDSTDILSEKKLALSNLSGIANQIGLDSVCDTEVFPSSVSNEKLNSNNSQISTMERLLSIDLNIQENINEQNELLSDPSIFLNSTKNDTSKMDVSLNSGLSDLKQNLDTSNFLLTSNVIPDVEYVPNQISNSMFSGRVNTYTQVPSVPQSPNTRRRAFNFMPISPRHTPIPESLNANGTSNISSPVPNQYPRNMMSIAVGPSQPPSNAGSPFVSPRSTPVSMCRSRHSSDQSTYSTSRHTPFQNFDSGVSSVSSSPFISPQPTPIPVSRLRHNSSHGSSKTVTFCSVNNPQIMHSQSSNSMGQLRSRHNSGPGGPHVPGNLCALRSAPQSPLVNEQCPPSNFVFPSSGSEVRSRHNSGSTTTTPLSPVSEQASSSSSCTSNLPDLSSVTETAPSISHSFLTDGAGDLLINGNPSNFRQVRQRHASSSVIYTKPYLALKDNSSEVQSLLKNSDGRTSGSLFSNRSQSVPLHQMLQNLDSFYFLSQPLEEPPAKSHPTTPVMNQMFSFPLLSSGQENSAVLSSDLLNRDKSLVSSSQMEWTGLEATGDIDMAARRNLTSLLDPPLSDDLQTTLEDLRDCDTDFSKFAQELELSQNDDGSLQYDVK